MVAHTHVAPHTHAHSLPHPAQMLLATEGVDLQFTDAAVKEVARLAEVGGCWGSAGTGGMGGTNRCATWA